MIDKRAEAPNPQLWRMAPVEAIQDKAARVGMVWWQFQQRRQCPRVLARGCSAESCAMASLCGVVTIAHGPARQGRSDLTPCAAHSTAGFHAHDQLLIGCYARHGLNPRSWLREPRFTATIIP